MSVLYPMPEADVTAATFLVPVRMARDVRTWLNENAIFAVESFADHYQRSDNPLIPVMAFVIARDEDAVLFKLRWDEEIRDEIARLDAEFRSLVTGVGMISIQTPNSKTAHAFQQLRQHVVATLVDVTVARLTEHFTKVMREPAQPKPARKSYGAANARLKHWER